MLCRVDYETHDYESGRDESAETDSQGDPYWYMTVKFSRAEHRSFTVLSSVCWNWHQTLIGWQHSSSPLQVKHKLKKLIARECTYVYCVFCIHILFLK